jgi:hypothetical protein
MHKKRILWIAIVMFICGLVAMKFMKNGSTDENSEDGSKPKKQKIEYISTDFNANAFTGKVEEKLLKEIGICDSTQADDTNLDKPSCSPRFFRFFKLNKAKELNESCMLMVRAGVNGFPVRRLLIFERERGKIVKVNGFVGYLIERRSTETNYDDIVVRFFERYDKQKYFYNCLYTWKGGQYQYVCCEAINDFKLKPEKADSVSIEVKKILNEKRLVY